MSVTASDDVDVDIRSTSTATDPSVTEPEQSIEEKTSSSVSSSKTISPTVSKGPVLLLRRQPATVTQTAKPSTLSTGDSRQSTPTRGDSGTATPSKETVDPSLLEAFANPMNRQYLLQLEETLNNFIAQSRF